MVECRDETKRNVAADLIKAALEAARHELATLHGLWATDRPDRLGDLEVYFQIDTKKTAELLDQAIKLLGDKGIHLS